MSCVPELLIQHKDAEDATRKLAFEIESDIKRVKKLEEDIAERNRKQTAGRRIESMVYRLQSLRLIPK